MDAGPGAKRASWEGVPEAGRGGMQGRREGRGCSWIRSVSREGTGFFLFLFHGMLGGFNFLFCQVNYAKLLKRGCFFTWHKILGVGKSQDLPTKI